MTINPADAIKAFQQAARLGQGGLEPRAAPEQGSFADMVGRMVGQAVESGTKAEAVTAQAVAGEADLMDVVTAVTNAELTLQAVVAVRDRVINAYQEIMRMPI
jgi:flagellar hook-basal body complex protein FliE